MWYNGGEKGAEGLDFFREKGVRIMEAKEIRERGGEVVKLVASVYLREFARFRRFEKADAISEGVLAVYENAEMYDEGKGSFSTFVCMMARYGILEYMRRESREKNRWVELGELEDYLGYEYSFSDLNREDVKKVLEVADGMSEREKGIILEFAKGKNGTQVAKERGCSKQNVSHVFTRFKNKCREKYKIEDGAVVEK